MHNFSVIFRLDAGTALRSKWFWGYCLVILAAIGSIFAAGVTDSRVMGFTGLTRLLVIFIQASNLVLPVFILVSTVRTLVKERETSVFEYLLSFPVSLGEYYWGKALARFVIIAAPLAASLLIAALVSVLRGQTVPWSIIGLYTLLLVFNTFFFVGLSFFISSFVRTQEMGLAVALLVWLTLVAFLDVVLLGVLIKALVPENVIYALALVNPIQIFKIAALSLFDPVLSVIGPAAYFILDIFGSSNFFLYALAYLLGFGLLFLGLGFLRFRSRDLV